MCNLGEALWDKAFAKGYEEGFAQVIEEERKLFAVALTSYMISELGFSKEEAENKINDFISNMDKDTSLVM